jgi:hypothetical protein
MADTARTNIVVMWTAGPDDVAEGEAIATCADLPAFMDRSR